MSDMNISIPAGEKKRLLTGGKYCPDDIVVEAEGGDTDAAFEAGRQAEYDAFWDAFQRNGEEYLYYGYAFASSDLWTQEAIDKIKYKHLKTTYFSVVFTGNTSVRDLSAFSFEAKAQKGLSATFNGCTNLERCMAINCDYVYEFYANTFQNCTKMYELLLSGEFKRTGLDTSWSPLNKPSLVSIINALSLTPTYIATGNIITLRLSSVNAAFETSPGANDGAESTEWLDLVATKPMWTINLIDS